MSDETRIIPVREPEDIQAEIKKKRPWDVDGEKVATTSLKVLIVRGVEIRSRYCKAHEFEIMKKIILALDPPVSGHIKSIWCDSKASCVYSVELRRWNEFAAIAIGDLLDEAALEISGGHNGIFIEAEGHTINVDPNWREDLLA